MELLEHARSAISNREMAYGPLKWRLSVPRPERTRHWCLFCVTPGFFIYTAP